MTSTQFVGFIRTYYYDRPYMYAQFRSIMSSFKAGLPETITIALAATLFQNDPMILSLFNDFLPPYQRVPVNHGSRAPPYTFVPPNAGSAGASGVAAGREGSGGCAGRSSITAGTNGAAGATEPGAGYSGQNVPYYATGLNTGANAGGVAGGESTTAETCIEGGIAPELLLAAALDNDFDFTGALNGA
jgi:hypothetical protein